jgi:hypothetical protein
MWKWEVRNKSYCGKVYKETHYNSDMNDFYKDVLC